MPKLIVFLGNPGLQYRHTRHNAGWLVCDSFIANKTNKTNENWANKFHSQYMKNGDFVLLKPQTFMNESGIATQEAKKFYNIESKDILVVHDDIELPFGSIKLQFGGGMGGHNGLKSIKTHLGTDEFARLRIGVGRPPKNIQVANFVLGRFSVEEEKQLEKILNEASLKVKDFIDWGIAK